MAVSRTVLKSTGAALTVSLLAAQPAWSIDFIWNVAGPASWHDFNNWLDGAVPSGGGGSHALINNGGTAEITTDIMDIQDIFVAAGAGTSGTLNHSAGNTFQGSGSWMFVGQDGGTGIYNISGTAIEGKDRLYIGRSTGGGAGIGTLNASGSAQIYGVGGLGTGELVVGIDGGSVGTANFSNSATVNVGFLGFGLGDATGNLTATDDSQLLSSGNAEFQNGTYTIGGNTLIDAGNEVWFGQGGGKTATVDMDSGIVEATTWLAVGRGGSTGTLNLSGDAIVRKIIDLNNGNSASSFITLGGLDSGGGGFVNISGNAQFTSETGILIAETNGRTSAINQTGGLVSAKDFENGTAEFGESIDLNPLGGTAGTYNISGGTLMAETIDNGRGGFNMTGGTVMATGFIGDLVQNGGTLAPGQSPGTMTITGNYTLAAGALEIEIDGTAVGTEYDQLIVTGDVSLAGDLTLEGAFAPAFFDVFTIIDNQGNNAVAGTFTGLSEGSVVSYNGVDLTISYVGGDGNDVVLSAPVPEPGSFALIGLGGLCLLRRRRRA